jgi:FkbM family methyltransferase
VDWLRALPAGARLFDIGANIGITALLAAERIDRSVDVVAVEPFPANYASLVKNISLNGFEDKIIAMPVGVGSKTEISQYNWASAEAGAALHSFGVMIRPRTGQTIAAVSYHRCLCYRLDDLVRIPGLGFPSHLKIDVDGSELDVLAGAESVLADPRCVGVQIEANERHSLPGRLSTVGHERA